MVIYNLATYMQGHKEYSTRDFLGWAITWWWQIMELQRPPTCWKLQEWQCTDWLRSSWCEGFKCSVLLTSIPEMFTRYLLSSWEKAGLDSTLNGSKKLEERGRQALVIRRSSKVVLSVKQGRHWSLLAIEVRPWSRVYESLNIIIRLINSLANP